MKCTCFLIHSASSSSSSVLLSALQITIASTMNKRLLHGDGANNNRRPERQCVGFVKTKQNENNKNLKKRTEQQQQQVQRPCQPTGNSGRFSLSPTEVHKSLKIGRPSDMLDDFSTSSFVFDQPASTRFFFVVSVFFVVYLALYTDIYIEIYIYAYRNKYVQ